MEEKRQKAVKPLVLFHGRNKYCKNNSAAAVRESLKFHPDVIELDIRKSKDGVLYCYHGLEPFAKLLRFFSFDFLEKALKLEERAD